MDVDANDVIAAVVIVFLVIAVVVGIATSGKAAPGTKGGPATPPQPAPPEGPEKKVGLAVWSEMPPGRRAAALRDGAVVCVGPGYMAAQMGIMKEVMGRGFTMMIMGFAHASELGFPEVSMDYCMLVFAHTLPGRGKVTKDALHEWIQPLMVTAFGPAGAPRSPKQTCTAAETDRELLLQLEWTSVSSTVVAETASKLEHAFLARGGSY